MWLLSCKRSLICELTNYSPALSNFASYNQIILWQGVHLEIIKIYVFHWKAIKLWQQEAQFEPPVARTLCFLRLFQ